MILEPLSSPAKQLFNFVSIDPVVLLIVQHRKKDIQMVEQFAEANPALQNHRKIGALSPLGKGLVQRKSIRLHFVAQRLEEPSQEPLTPPTGHGRDFGPQGE